MFIYESRTRAPQDRSPKSLRFNFNGNEIEFIGGFRTILRDLAIFCYENGAEFDNTLTEQEVIDKISKTTFTRSSFHKLPNGKYLGGFDHATSKSALRLAKKWTENINVKDLVITEVDSTQSENDDDFDESESIPYEDETKSEISQDENQNTSNLSANDSRRVSNPFRQCVCILGDPGVGKSVTAIETISKDTNHKFYLSIPTDLSTSMLLQFVRGKLELNRVSNMIIEAYKNPDKKYTVLIDEFHKSLTIKRVNDELLQAISTKRYRERRFISSEIAESLISEKLDELGFTEDQYSFHGNIEVPKNFGFVLLSSKPNVIVDNEDLYDRMDIVYLRTEDQGTINTIQDLESKKIETSEKKKKFKELVKSQDKDDDSWRESFDAFLNEISLKFTNERLSNVFKFNDWRKL